MGGIAGCWGGSDFGLVRGMADEMAYRGPDGSSYINKPGLGNLVQQHLAVLDFDGERGSVTDQDKSRSIICDGEIYNFRTLRRALDDSHEFTTRSSSEVALHLFEDMGSIMIRKLDGMFALAIADEELFLARDPLGVKPLYYAIGPDQDDRPSFFFSSEIKALAHLGLDVHEFPPGTCYSTKSGFMPYLRLPDIEPRPRPFQTLVSMVRETLEEIIVKRLVSDAPFGVFLSGGLDSSIVAAVASRHIRPLHTFTVGTVGAPDLDAARVVARHIGSEHHEYILDPAEIARDLPAILHHLESFDRNLVRSAIPCFYCSRLASDHVKAVLTGDGADELFAGYPYHREFKDPQMLHVELRRSISALHNLGLQRLDRTTAAHGIEGRVPYLDLDMVNLALTIPPDLKLHLQPTGELIDKWILRAAFDDLLPDGIVSRQKVSFAEGSGTLDVLWIVLSNVARLLGPDKQDKHAIVKQDRSQEICIYQTLIAEAFGASAPILENVGRWKRESS